jgi:hypothetical protein
MGPSPLCVAGQGCQSCSNTRCGTTCCAPPPANASTVCSGSNACAVQCNSSTHHACSGTQSPCYANNDPQHCGSSCTDCSQPNAIAACVSGACSNTCAGTPLGCVISPGKPACGTWGFESNTPEGFTLEGTSTASDGLFRAVNRRASKGSYSLAIGYVATGGEGVVDVRFKPCPNGQGLDFSTRTLKMDVYAETASGSQPHAANRNGNYVTAYNGSDYLYGGCDSQHSDSDRLFAWDCSDSPLPSEPVTDIILRFRVFEPWRGTFYLDNVRFE